MGMKVGMRRVIVAITQLNIQVHFYMCLLRRKCCQSLNAPIKQKPTRRRPLNIQFHLTLILVLILFYTSGSTANP